MRSSLFSDLPPEVILQVFRFGDNFATVNALLRTSSVFHCIWLLNANTIAAAVLPRAIPYHAEATSLVQAQEQEAKLNPTYNGGPRCHREEVIVKAKRFFSASDLLRRYYDDSIFPTRMNIGLPQDGPFFILLDRDRFLPAFYRLKTLAILFRVMQIPSEALNGVSKDDLIDMCEITSWLRRKCPHERQEELGVKDLLSSSRWLQKWFDTRLAQLRTTKASSS